MKSALFESNFHASICTLLTIGDSGDIILSVYKGRLKDEG